MNALSKPDITEKLNALGYTDKKPTTKYDVLPITKPVKKPKTKTSPKTAFNLLFTKKDEPSKSLV